LDLNEGAPMANDFVEIRGHSPGCIFCKIARQEMQAEVVAKFTHCYAMKDAYPVSKGHILIIPFEHTENWFTAREEVRLDMMQALHIIKADLDAEYKPDGYNIGANCGAHAGQTVMHLHLHLIPRYKGDMANPRGGVRGVIPSKQSY
jgi:diadenosine tetraphosphate (Ap4A) HIT family hydrolase